MQLAILFWFYKEPAICENRLQILRRYNPDTKIYGLYGGTLDQAAEFEERLAPYLDDFYTFREDRSAHWRWYHGDRMLSTWYAERGLQFAWDSIFVAQWDMLIFDRIERQLSDCGAGTLVLSGLRPINEVDPWWSHIHPGTPDRAAFDQFMQFVRTEYDYQGEPMCCEFIVACLPREFLSRYAAISNPELGFLEYKIPTYAQIFGIPLCAPKRHIPWWADDPSTADASLFARALNAESEGVPLRIVAAHLALPRGRRIFHPVFEIFPVGLVAQVKKIGKEIYHQEIKKRWWRLQRRFIRD